MKHTIASNAAEIRRLHARVHEAFARRDESDTQRCEWERACAEFHARYGALAFPGGEDDAYRRVERGERNAVEAALCFLELRPYFFRSGYMFKKLLRRIKRARLSPEQAARLRVVLEKGEQWRRQKLERQAPGASASRDGDWEMTRN